MFFFLMENIIKKLNFAGGGKSVKQNLSENCRAKKSQIKISI